MATGLDTTQSLQIRGALLSDPPDYWWQVEQTALAHPSFIVDGHRIVDGWITEDLSSETLNYVVNMARTNCSSNHHHHRLRRMPIEAWALVAVTDTAIELPTETTIPRFDDVGLILGRYVDGAFERLYIMPPARPTPGTPYRASDSSRLPRSPLVPLLVVAAAGAVVISKTRRN